MFSSKKQIEKLELEIETLQKKIKNIEENSQAQIKILRQQLLSFAMSFPLSGDAILNGLSYSEIPKERVSEFLKAHPEVLVLDVRSDEGWNAGHIAGAKHIQSDQVISRLHEIPNKKQPILTVCANGNTGLTIAQQLSQQGYLFVFNALGGMAGYQGPLEAVQQDFSDVNIIEGEDRNLIQQVIEIIDRDVRPGLKKDGGDIRVLSVHAGVVTVKMMGACLGCGALNTTVNDGIKKHLLKSIPQLTDLVLAR